MRKTYAYNSIIIGFLLAALVGGSTESIVLAVVVFVVVTVGGFILIRAFEDSVERGAEMAGNAISDFLKKKSDEKKNDTNS